MDRRKEKRGIRKQKNLKKTQRKWGRDKGKEGREKEGRRTVL